MGAVLLLQIDTADKKEQFPNVYALEKHYVILTKLFEKVNKAIKECDKAQR